MTRTDGRLAPELVDGSARATEIANEVLARIMRGEYPIGARLRQERLASEFGVSRTPVREALRVLQTSGVIELLPNRGATVRVPSPLDLREAYQVRAELEGMAAELAARWVTGRELEQLREAEALFRSAVEEATGGDAAGSRLPTAWVDANYLFHGVVQQAARNEQLRQTIAYLHRRIPRILTWGALREDPALLRENARQHQAIREAIERHDELEARRLMAHHVRHAGELGAMWVERRQRELSSAEPRR